MQTVISIKEQITAKLEVVDLSTRVEVPEHTVEIITGTSLWFLPTLYLHEPLSIAMTGSSTY